MTRRTRLGAIKSRAGAPLTLFHERGKVCLEVPGRHILCIGGIGRRGGREGRALSRRLVSVRGGGRGRLVSLLKWNVLVDDAV